MSSQLIFSVKDALVRYKETPVFEDLTLNIHQGSRIALVGKNGAGKSTIMNIITGVKSLDEGERWENPGTTDDNAVWRTTSKSGLSKSLC